MTSSTYLVCLMALLPIIFSLPTPPITTDPAIKIQVTAKGLKQVSTLLQPELLRLTGEAVDIDFEVDDSHYNGTFKVTHVPTTEIVALASDRPAESYEGFEKVDDDSDDSDSHDRYRRDVTTASAKVLYEDEAFLAGKQLGGLLTTLKDFTIEFDLTSGTHHYKIDATHVTLKVVTILGQDEGQLKVGRIAAELDGELVISKDGHDVPLTKEQRDEYYEKILELIVKRYQKEFNKEVTEFTQALGSSSLPHIVFDFRLTEHPQFKDGGVELSFVGKFVYDGEDKYKVSKIPEVEEALSVLGYLKMFQTKDAQPLTHGTTYTKKYVLVDHATTPHVDALAAEGTDAAEAERATKSCVRVILSEDFFNSLFQTVVESGYFDFSFDKDQISGLASLYTLGTGQADLDLSILPADLSLRITPTPVEGHKYIQFLDGKKIDQFSIGVKYGDKFAEYKLHAEAKVLFRAGKQATDIIELYVEKVADEGYPELFGEKELKGFFDAYYGNVASQLQEGSEQDAISEFAITDKHITLGLDLTAAI